MNFRSKLLGYFKDATKVAFGPWHINIWAVPILFGVVFNFSSIEITKAMENTTSANWSWGSHVPNAIYVSSWFLLAGYLVNLFNDKIRNKPMDRTTYLLGVAFIAVFGTTARAYLMPWGEFTHGDSPGQILGMSVRIFIAALIGFAALGINNLRLKQQIMRAETALTEVEDQRRVIISNDENLRSSIAAYLHDNVQASLVALAMQLKLVTNRVDTQTAAEITSIIDGLEEVRSSEVRKASHRLSPDISALGLPAAIKELAATYEPWMLTTVTIVEQWPVGAVVPERRNLVTLGAYRMVEQALLNSVIHGRARRVEVTIMLNDDELTLDIKDDGAGFKDGTYQPGLGSKVIDAWVQSLKGGWTIASNIDFGVHVHACLPMHV